MILGVRGFGLNLNHDAKVLFPSEKVNGWIWTVMVISILYIYKQRPTGGSVFVVFGIIAFRGVS